MLLLGPLQPSRCRPTAEEVHERVTSLKVLAWEALCHSTPSLGSLPSSLLVEEGVPRDCVDMLATTETSLNQAECG